MTVALSETFHYFAVDCDHDLGGALVELSMDKETWTAATHDAPSDAAQARAAKVKPVPRGMTRYWVRAMSGPGKDLELGYGINTVHGRITDLPEVLRIAWRVDVPSD